MITQSSQNINIRLAHASDAQAIWDIFRPIARRGETYAFNQNINQQEGLNAWMTIPDYTFVAEKDDEVLGTYYLKTNQQGPGCHVCNCGYMVADRAQGQGLATLMCEHSKQFALQQGYLAMQFNFVASTNQGAIKLWKKLGFDIVGRLPKAFRHPTQGLVDALVMYQWLE